MDLYYVAMMRFPNEKAHGKQVREMCNALAGEVTTTLVIPTRTTEGDARSFGLNERVRIVRIPTPDLVSFGRPGFLFSYAWFAFFSTLYVRTRPHAAVLTREHLCAALLALVGVRTAWETHRGEWHSSVRLAAALGARFICITRGLADFYRSKEVSDAQISVAPDGVDLARYQNLPSREEAREKVGLPKGVPIAIYNGHLHTWKGAGTLAEAAALLPEEYRVFFMGGTDDDIAAFREKFGDTPQIVLLGRKSDDVRPLYLRAADVAVLPNTGTDEISVKFTSPLKLFGYMASGTVVLSSDLPSLREVLSEDTAYFASADDAASFAQGIQRIIAEPAQAHEKAARARALVEGYTWESRARGILATLRAE